MMFDNEFYRSLLKKAEENMRLRINYDLRTTAEDGSQRMLNAMMPGTKFVVHRHPDSTECVVCLYGSLVEILYDNNGRESGRTVLSANGDVRMMKIDAGVWHTVLVTEPCVIFEAKDGKYGEDGSEVACW